MTKRRGGGRTIEAGQHRERPARLRGMATKNVGDLVRADVGKSVTYKAGPNQNNGRLNQVIHSGNQTAVTIDWNVLAVPGNSEHQTIEIHD
jgi:hypothetical protein